MTAKIQKIESEDIYDACTRIVLTRGNNLISSIKEGDHINIMDESFDDEDENYNDFINAEYKTISVYDLLNQTQRSALSAKKYKEDNFKEIEIRRIYKVVRIEKEIPIVVGLPYPDEKNFKAKEISLSSALYDFATSFSDRSGYDKGMIEALEKFFDHFVTLDKDFVDTILLDSEYTPYASSLPFLEEFKESLRDEEQERRKEAAREAARTRAARKQDAKVVEEYFQHIIKKLEKSDLQFAQRKIAQRGK